MMSELIWQRRIIAAASRRLVPVIVATQMLESMIEHPRPTRAEASDVANAVWDGADALMLSAESAAGAYPVESVEMMDRIIRSTEESETPATHHDESSWASDPARSISWATREILLHDDSIAGVVVFTMSGYSARPIAKGHLPRDVLAITVDPRVQQQLALLWGVRAVICPMFTNEAQVLAAVTEHARSELGCEDGDTVAVVGSMPVGQRGPTNSLTLHRIGAPPGRRGRDG